MSAEMTNMALMVPQSGSLEAYVQSVNRIPMLSAEEERELAERLVEDNDLEVSSSADHVAFALCCACCAGLFRLRVAAS